MNNISKNAVVSPKAVLGDNITIKDFSSFAQIIKDFSSSPLTSMKDFEM